MWHSSRVGECLRKLGVELRRGESSATGAEQSIAARLASLVCPPRLRPSVTTLAMQAIVPSGLRAPGNPPYSSLKRSDFVKHLDRSAGLRCDRNSGGLLAMGTLGGKRCWGSILRVSEGVRRLQIIAEAWTEALSFYQEVGRNERSGVTQRRRQVTAR